MNANNNLVLRRSMTSSTRQFPDELQDLHHEEEEYYDPPLDMTLTQTPTEINFWQVIKETTDLHRKKNSHIPMPSATTTTTNTNTNTNAKTFSSGITPPKPSLSNTQPPIFTSVLTQLTSSNNNGSIHHLKSSKAAPSPLLQKLFEAKEKEHDIEEQADIEYVRQKSEKVLRRHPSLISEHRRSSQGSMLSLNLALHRRGSREGLIPLDLHLLDSPPGVTPPKALSSPFAPPGSLLSPNNTRFPSSLSSSAPQSHHKRRQSLFQKLTSPFANRALIYTEVDTTNKGKKLTLEQKNNDEYAKRQAETYSQNPFLQKVRQKAFEARARQEKKRRSVINPSQKWKLWWDGIIGLFILYSVVIIPWRFSFDNNPEDFSFFFFFDILNDLFFLTDMILVFLTGFRTQEGRYITSHRTIATRYLKSWFLIDFLSTVPFDHIVNAVIPASGNDANAIRSVKLIRGVRLVRLVKLVRAIRLSSKLSNFEIDEFISPSLVRLVKLLCRIMFIAHLLACFWFYMNSCESLLVRAAEGVTMVTDNVWVSCGNDSYQSQYIASFYWTISTMMAVGYGDIAADTNDERAYAILTQVLGAVSFGFIIATVTIIIRTIDPEAEAKKRRSEELRDYLHERNYSVDVRKKTKRHFAYFQSKTSTYAELSIVSDLSHTLKEVILFESRQHLLPIIKVFHHGVSDQFTTDCLLRLKPMLLSHLQCIGGIGDISEEVYFVTKGRIEALQVIPLPPTLVEPGSAASKSYNKSVGTPPEQSEKVVCALFSDGYEFELANCMLERPMDLIYRAAAVTDLVWLDHASLLYLNNAYPRSAHSLKYRVNRFDAIMEEVTKSEIIRYPECSMRKLMFHNSHRVNFIDIQELVLRSIRNHNNTLITSDRKAKERSKRSKHSKKGDEAHAAPTPAPAPPQVRSRNITKISLDFINKLTKSNSGEDVDYEYTDAVSIRTWVWNEARGRLIETEETDEDLADRYLLNPYSALKVRWDLCIGLLIITSVIIVPVRLGFDLSSTVPWLVFDWTTDFIFLMDIGLNFRTGYMDDHEILHTKPILIANNYFRGWLVIDWFSTLPLDKIIDYIMRDNTTADAGNFKGLKLIRIIRLVRLAKLLKLFKQQSLSAAGDMISIDPTLLKSLKLFGTLVFIGHLFGCFFSYITLENVQEYGPATSFSAEIAANEYYNENVPIGYASWWLRIGIEENDVWSRYLAGLYWAFTTMTTVGYGDVIPTNDSERIYASVIMILGATVFGYIVGSVSGLASNVQGVYAKLEERKAIMGNYLEEQNIKPALRKFVKEQLVFTSKFRSVFDEARILSCFPINIRRQMIMEAHTKTIRSISIFQDDISLITNIMGYMKAAYFSAGQFIYRSSDEGSKAIMFLLEGIAEEVPDDPSIEEIGGGGGSGGGGSGGGSGVNTPAPGSPSSKTATPRDKLFGHGNGTDSTINDNDVPANPKPSINFFVSNPHMNIAHPPPLTAPKDQKGKLSSCIIEAGKVFGYQCFLGEEHTLNLAYRAFTSCSIMMLCENEMKAIVGKHPVLRNKLMNALKVAIEKQSSSDVVLKNQILKMKKKNDMFKVLQNGFDKKNLAALRIAIAKEEEAEKDLEVQLEVEEEARAEREREAKLEMEARVGMLLGMGAKETTLNAGANANSNANPNAVDNAGLEDAVARFPLLNGGRGASGGMSSMLGPPTITTAASQVSSSRTENKANVMDTFNT